MSPEISSSGCRYALPGGNRNTDGSFNNAGSNANFWSSSENDAQNAWNRNLDAGNETLNRNNNNKTNGFSVRCLKDWKPGLPLGPEMGGGKDLVALYGELFRAWQGARRHKRSRMSAMRFEVGLESELWSLASELHSGTYQPRAGNCFINRTPVLREVFAAEFRDRVVHHLLFNRINSVVERTLIHDTYSCRKGKGTHFGIRRAEGFLRACSQDGKRDCWVLRLDIRSYFNSINKATLWKVVQDSLSRARPGEIIDMETTKAWLHKVIFHDPSRVATVKGSLGDWDDLPLFKSLFDGDGSCGLPIGNLTSQLFGNLYLSGLDHFVKRTLGVTWYGRYVDDLVLMDPDPARLRTLVPTIDAWLREHRGLQLHSGKTSLQPASHGFAFLGAWILPNRTYLGNRGKRNAVTRVNDWNRLSQARAGMSPRCEESFLATMNSTLGLCRPFKTYRLRRRLVGRLSPELRQRFAANAAFTKLSESL